MVIRTAQGMVYYEYYLSSQGNASTVIYLHGLGGDCKAWEFMVTPTIQAGYNCLLIDLPGHGLSYRLNRDYHWDEFTSAVHAVVCNQQLKKSILVGHCLGGIVALAYASQYKSAVKQLLLFNSSITISDWVNFFQYIAPLSNLVPKSAVYKHINHQHFKGTGDFYIPRLVSDISHVGVSSYVKILGTLADIMKQTHAENINIPALVVGGKEDRIFALNRQMFLADQLPLAKLKVIKTNHISVLNAPDEVQQCILDEL